MAEDFITSIFMEFTTWLVIAISAVIGTSVFAYFKSLKKCQMETSSNVDKLNKRSFRQSQAILQLASSIDKQSKRLHADDPTDLLDDVSRTLRDEAGNL